MVFDIVSQKLKCLQCESLQDVGKGESDVKEAGISDTFEVRMYTCPVCGAELATQEGSAVSFCSYCDAQTVLTDRLEIVKRPDYIIPFKKTKIDCQKIYKKKLRTAIYAPNAMLKQGHIDSFRGIYMPYYVYDIEQKGAFHLTADEFSRDPYDVNYKVCTTYLLEGDVVGDYRSLTHDASNNFPDIISECIAPFNMEESVPFGEEYLYGFYADIPNVKEVYYRQYVTELAEEYAYYTAYNNRIFRKFSINETMEDSVHKNTFGTKVKNASKAMLPVWFLSYYMRGRMSYATINGQTGRMHADIPVAIWKYLLFSIITAVPLYFILNLFVTITPPNLLILCSAIQFLALRFYHKAVDKLQENRERVIKGGRLSEQKHIKMSSVVMTGIVCAIMLIMFIFNMTEDLFGLSGIFSPVTMSFAYRVVSGIITVAGIGYAIKVAVDADYVIEVNAKPPTFIAMGVFLVCGAVSIWQPVKDIYYYIACYGVVAAIVVFIITLIWAYNICITRPLEMFDRTGGDNSGLE